MEDNNELVDINMEKSKKLKKMLSSGETLVMPDAYDPISAKLIESAGFKAVQCSGYSFSIAAGYENETDVSLKENIEWTRRIVDSVKIPVMADAEDGYGDPEEVLETVEKFIDIGVAGLNLEDQIPDGKNTISVVDEELMMQKLIVSREVAEVKDNADFVINGRTDALKSTDDRKEGLKIAVKRANQYLKSGADLVFITYVETLDEVKRITKEVKGPLSIAAGLPYNIGNFSIDDLKRCGVARVSLPTLLIFSSLSAIRNTLNNVNENNLSKSADFLDNINDLNLILKK